MKKTLFVIVTTFLLVGCNDVPLYKDASKPVEKRVKDLLGRMTVEEKAAQLDMMDAGSILESSKKLSIEKMDKLMKENTMGSIHDLYPASAALSNEIQKYVREQTRLGIPPILIEEALHGYQG
ncbi:MAG: beta-glucosidase, partial [Prevotellaceae bacterium]|nr:beta-glucosidase [Prevotellaceae bacterium]